MVVVLSLGGKGEEVPPPYKAMRPVRASSWFFNPFFSTSCWAMVSPVANRTAVVMLWVSRGLEASFLWYLHTTYTVSIDLGIGESILSFQRRTYHRNILADAFL